MLRILVTSDTKSRARGHRGPSQGSMTRRPYVPQASSSHLRRPRDATPWIHRTSNTPDVRLCACEGSTSAARGHIKRHLCQGWGCQRMLVAMLSIRASAVFAIGAVFGFGAIFASAQDIVAGATWTDTSGNAIQAHGGGFLKVGSTYYWFGEDKSHNSALFKAVSCYTSTNFVTWTRQNDALTPISGTMISTSDIVERPKVIFNSKVLCSLEGSLVSEILTHGLQNSEYVMWFHSDTSNYDAAMVGVATAKSPCGPYTYKSSFKPLGADSRDMSLFQDNEVPSNASWWSTDLLLPLAAQSAYLLYASDNNQNFKITKLDANYYNVTTEASVLNGATLEAPGIVKRNNVYYLIASHTSGWDPNPNKWFSASSLSGPWSSQADIAPEDTRTYFSQNAYDLPLGSNAIYMGDRWRPDLLGSSRYIWYPLDWSSGSPQIVHADVWTVNLGAGTYTAASGTTYEAESGTRSGSSTLITDSSFSGGKGVGYLGNGGSVTLNVQGSGKAQWVSIYYANGDSTWRNTTVSVNGGSSVLVDQPDTGSGNDILSVPVQLTLQQGSNTIAFGVGQSTYAGDLDKIIVYSS
ncbi:hypothetical protein EVG20_g3526 [Dentipellis fragilis]|uniref:CBM6 domain-containing protein n=1 Tax=Dentipellis fragilis TaxID=205917 RepID=A0A4Y9Z3D8_9AGAM|nr:hypothetical protein EVG20_g3526 [Dentipellis fragilis]